MKRTIVIASSNEGKIEEIKPSLLSHGFKVLTLRDFPHVPINEDGKTFRENAEKKARAVATLTKFPVIADDSGLEVDALSGAPGVHSKRFSHSGLDADNNARLLSLMENKTNRRACFKTIIVLKESSGDERIFEGRLDGYIHTVSEGDEGFGYDSVFIPVGYHETLAQLGSVHKQNMSHRQKALSRLSAYLKLSDV